MLPNLTCVLIYSLTKCCALEDVLTTAVVKTCNICRKISVTEFNVKEIAVCRVATSSNEMLRQICNLGN